MIQKMPMSSGGGGSIQDLPTIIRCSSGHKQGYWLGAFINQYKYVRLLTKAETQSIMGDMGDNINLTSVLYNTRINNTWGSDRTLSTTDMDTSTLNLGDADLLYVGFPGRNTWEAFCVYFHN